MRRAYLVCLVIAFRRNPPHDKGVARYASQDALGDTAEKELDDGAATVGAQDDQVHALLFGMLAKQIVGCPELNASFPIGKNRPDEIGAVPTKCFFTLPPLGLRGIRIGMKDGEPAPGETGSSSVKCLSGPLGEIARDEYVVIAPVNAVLGNEDRNLGGAKDLLTDLPNRNRPSSSSRATPVTMRLHCSRSAVRSIASAGSPSSMRMVAFGVTAPTSRRSCLRTLSRRSGDRFQGPLSSSPQESFSRTCTTKSSADNSLARAAARSSARSERGLKSVASSRRFGCEMPETVMTKTSPCSYPISTNFLWGTGRIIIATVKAPLTMIHHRAEPFKQLLRRSSGAK